jgi:hypothetical protein
MRSRSPTVIRSRPEVSHARKVATKNAIAVPEQRLKAVDEKPNNA